TLDDLTRYGLGGYDASNEVSIMDSWDDNVVRYESMVADAFPQFEMSEENVEEAQHDSNPNAQRFYELLESVRKPLWEERWPPMPQESLRTITKLELGRTPTHSEVFARTHTRKEDRSWVDKRAED
ncbi:hypothetical protein PIB30_114306, partial [Stylosanthes scabra]|nr:hypothetical protein [Stylosanthes scabra]